ncbi:MAG: hypothetical protein IJS91_05060 [Bacteroidales bacterium]|nr:hypothetical protein [Bacteroidales bacterium]
MKRLTILLTALILTGCLTGCEGLFGPGSDNALTIRPAGASKAETLTYPIKSVFIGGGVADPEQGSSHRCHMFEEAFTACPDVQKVTAIVEVYGFRFKGVEYKSLAQAINEIYINGLDEALGLGTRLIIFLNQGKFDENDNRGSNGLIKSVRIDSYKGSSYNEEKKRKNKDADMRIVITSKAGDILKICYTHGYTPYDGYF